jgi:hypothetical protein
VAVVKVTKGGFARKLVKRVAKKAPHRASKQNAKKATKKANRKPVKKPVKRGRKTAAARQAVRIKPPVKPAGGKPVRLVNPGPVITYKIRELDPMRKCGPATSVRFLYRVDETKDGVVRPHLVYYDRHGWYCEHGRNCGAVSYAKNFGDGARKPGASRVGSMRT